MYHVIHCDKHTERENHIEDLNSLLGTKINIFRGYCPDSYEWVSDVDPDLKRCHTFDSFGHLGCYLSHHMLVKSLLGTKEGYSVIFEDDVTFEPGFHEEILKICEAAPPFDMILLGNYIHPTTYNQGDHVRDNIYHMNPKQDCYGTHALLVNNKSIEKIYNLNKTMDSHIDNKYVTHIKKGDLIGYVICPPLCRQGDYGSHTIYS